MNLLPYKPTNTKNCHTHKEATNKLEQKFATNSAAKQKKKKQSFLLEIRRIHGISLFYACVCDAWYFYFYGSGCTIDVPHVHQSQTDVLLQKLVRAVFLSPGLVLLLIYPMCVGLQ